MREVIEQSKIPRRTLYTGAGMPAIGIGTFGSDKYGEAEVAEAVYGAIGAGYRLVDCASVYQNEASIGNVLTRVMEEGIVSRKDLFVVSKVWNDMHGEGDVIKSCKKSLSDLQLDFGDYSCQCTLPDKSILDFSNKVAIERKMNLDELCLCFGKERGRFEREFERAKGAGCRIYLLVENGTWEHAYNGKFRSKYNPKALIASIDAYRARYGMQLDFCKSFSK